MEQRRALLPAVKVVGVTVLVHSPVAAPPR
jgi:hypothetical protein